MSFIPIDPTLKEDGSFLALSFYEKSAELTPVELAGEKPFTSFNVFQYHMSLDMAISLNLGAFFSGDASYNSLAIIYEAILFTDKFVEQPHGGLIEGTRWGSGLRLALKVSDMEIRGKPSVGLVAANIQLGVGSASYEINGIGISDPSILSVLPGPGSFDIDNYRSIMNATEKIKDYMSKHKDDLVPRPIAVSLTTPKILDKFKNAQSYYFAMLRLKERKTLKSAIEEIGSLEIDKDVVKMVYCEYGNILRDDIVPSHEIGSKARKWLKF